MPYTLWKLQCATWELDQLPLWIDCHRHWNVLFPCTLDPVKCARVRPVGWSHLPVFGCPFHRVHVPHLTLPQQQSKFTINTFYTPYHKVRIVTVLLDPAVHLAHLVIMMGPCYGKSSVNWHIVRRTSITSLYVTKSLKFGSLELKDQVRLFIT